MEFDMLNHWTDVIVTFSNLKESPLSTQMASFPMRAWSYFSFKDDKKAKKGDILF